MKLSLVEPKLLKESITIISDLVNEARFKITKNNIELVAMDPANVAMVIFKLFSSCFVEYSVKEDMEIAINLTNLRQILRRVNPTDTITLEAGEEGKSNKLKIIIKGNSTRTFEIPIIELEEKDQKIPELDFPVEIKTTSSLLSESIEDVDIVAEAVNFIAEKNKFVILAEGDLNKAKIEIDANEDTKITLSGDEDKIKAKYSIEYLKKMISGGKLADQVSIRFNKDYPLKIEFVSVDKLLLSFILAPRVEND